MRREKLVWSCRYRLDFSKPGDEASKWILNHRNHQQKLGEKQHYKPKNILYHSQYVIVIHPKKFVAGKDAT